MNKLSKKPLRLQTETLRQLDGDSLRLVTGGILNISVSCPGGDCVIGTIQSIVLPPIYPIYPIIPKF